MRLLGLDVGFSATRPSSGVALLSDTGELRVDHTTSRWEDRRKILGSGPIDLAAIDAPLTLAGENEPRGCERLFTLGLFQGRCKPGLSHIPGTGQQFRAAGTETSNQLKGITSPARRQPAFPCVLPTNLVEAFPNAFLGVCLSDSVYRGMPSLRRGQKFDWLYNQWISEGLFQSLVALVSGSAEMVGACLKNRQHDQRAALVCLLTAGGTLVGQYTAVGDAQGGFFFLPPWELWAHWAREELDKQRQRLPELTIWISGRRYASGNALPT